MTEFGQVKALFLDVGGVLLTNGWGRESRRIAAEKFHLDYEEFDERHHLTFDTYEEGKLDLDEYLNRVVFYQDRPFSVDEFKMFMFSVSQPFPDMIQMIREIKSRNRLKTVVVSNEGRELATRRFKQFNMREYIDAFVCSSFVHVRKPDEEIYRIALDISQIEPEQTAYIDDRAMFVDVANALGIRAVHHTDYATTCRALLGLGLQLPNRAAEGW